MAIFAALLLCGAEEAKNHITGQFELLRAGKNTISNKDGIVTITLFQKLNSGGAREIFHLNQNKPVAIEFGAESKLDTGLDGKAVGFLAQKLGKAGGYGSQGIFHLEFALGSAQMGAKDHLRLMVQ